MTLFTIRIKEPLLIRLLFFFSKVASFPHFCVVLTSEAPEKPLCPDLPTAAPTSSGTVDATSASSTDAKTAAVKAAEAMEGMPIPAGVVDQARISYKLGRLCLPDVSSELLRDIHVAKKAKKA